MLEIRDQVLKNPRIRSVNSRAFQAGENHPRKNGDSPSPADAGARTRFPTAIGVTPLGSPVIFIITWKAILPTQDAPRMPASSSRKLGRAVLFITGSNPLYRAAPYFIQ